MEQKNNDYDIEEQAALLNKLYKIKAKAAYQRLLEAEDVRRQVKRRLHKMYNHLNLR